MAQETVLTTGDSLAKPEHHNQVGAAESFPLSAPSPVSSVMSHWPEAEVEEKGKEVTEADFSAAKNEAVIALVEYFARTTTDQPLHKVLTSKLAILNGYESEKAAGNIPMATGGMIPVLDGPSGKVDDDVIPVTKAKTTDPTVQPADAKLPESGSDAISEKLKELDEKGKEAAESDKHQDEHSSFQ